MKSHRWTLWAASICCSILLLLCATAGLSATKQFIVFFDFPLSGVTDTEATAINPSGVVVGRYFTPDGHQHGFALNNNSFKSIDVASSTSTDAAWINAQGAIVGSYSSTDGKGHAYVLRDSVLTTIDFSADPNVNTTGSGISDAGDVVGVGFNGGDFNHGQGYLFSHGQITVINVPGATGTFPTMILDPGRIVGAYVGSDSGVHVFCLLMACRKPSTYQIPPLLGSLVLTQKGTSSGTM